MVSQGFIDGVTRAYILYVSFKGCCYEEWLKCVRFPKQASLSKMTKPGNRAY